jgi:hypothetical protein
MFRTFSTIFTRSGGGVLAAPPLRVKIIENVRNVRG